jgi:hypothetical protein
MEPKAREKAVSRWIKRVKPRDRMDATAAALELIGEDVPWDRKAAFDKQIEVANKTVAALDAKKRAEFEAQFPIAYVMLKKRIPLAFKVKTKLSVEQFDILRTGAHEGFGLLHYFAIFEEARLQKGLRNSLMIAIISCTITTLLAYAIAYGVNRRALPAPNLVRYAVLTPLVSPPVMIATAAILMFGRQGAFTKGLLDQTRRPVRGHRRRGLQLPAGGVHHHGQRAVETRRARRGGGGEPGREPMAGVHPGDAAAIDAGLAAHHHPGLHPRHDRLRQPAGDRQGYPRPCRHPL